MSHSRNPEDALDEIANNSVQLGTYKPVYPSDENRQQFGRPDEDIFDRHEEKRPKTTNSNRKSPKQVYLSHLMALIIEIGGRKSEQSIFIEKRRYHHCSAA